MKQLIEDLISAMEYHVEQTRPVHMTTVAIQAAKDALKAMPAAQPAVPLTDSQREEIAKGWRSRNWTVGDIIDATEAAHGITAAPEKGQP